MSSDTTNSKDNGAMLNIAKIMKSVMTSAAEAEIGTLFLNSRQAIPAKILLEKKWGTSNHQLQFKLTTPQH